MTQDLERIAPLGPEFRQDLGILTLRELMEKRRVRAFMEHMVGGLSAHAADFAGTKHSEAPR